MRAQLTVRYCIVPGLDLPCTTTTKTSFDSARRVAAHYLSAPTLTLRELPENLVELRACPLANSLAPGGANHSFSCFGLLRL